VLTTLRYLVRFGEAKTIYTIESFVIVFNADDMAYIIMVADTIWSQVLVLFGASTNGSVCNTDNSNYGGIQVPTLPQPLQLSQKYAYFRSTPLFIIHSTLPTPLFLIHSTLLFKSLHFS